MRQGVILRQSRHILVTFCTGLHLAIQSRTLQELQEHFYYSKITNTSNLYQCKNKMSYNY